MKKNRLGHECRRIVQEGKKHVYRWLFGKAGTGRKVKDGERVLVICSEYYRDVDDYDPVLRVHCRLSDEFIRGD